jgi:hypothetical protein
MTTITMPLEEYEALRREHKEWTKFRDELEERISKAFDDSSKSIMIRDDQNQLLWLNGTKKILRENLFKYPLKPAP